MLRDTSVLVCPDLVTSGSKKTKTQNLRFETVPMAVFHFSEKLDIEGHYLFRAIPVITLKESTVTFLPQISTDNNIFIFKNNLYRRWMRFLYNKTFC